MCFFFHSTLQIEKVESSELIIEGFPVPPEPPGDWTPDVQVSINIKNNRPFNYRQEITNIEFNQLIGLGTRLKTEKRNQ